MNFSNTVRWSLIQFAFVTSMPSIYAPTMSNPANKSDIFSWKILGLLETPVGNFCYSYLPQGSTIVRRRLDTGDSSLC